jgi:molecular chaperone GrpE
MNQSEIPPASSAEIPADVAADVRAKNPADVTADISAEVPAASNASAPAGVSADAAAGEATPDAPAASAEEIERALAELETLKDRHIRLQADFENFRRRTQRERAEAHARAHEELMRNLLPVLDHFEIGLRSAAEHGADEAVRSGFLLVQNELLRALERAGLTPLDAAPGDPFDPHLHEAVSHAPSDQYPPDTVLQATRRGYRLGPKLLRPAQVVVSSGPGPSTPAAAES